jgi:phage replication-related protein YjqB (UPF0714/DUF867 family)
MENSKLHITSSKFDEPRATKLAAECMTAIAIHRRKNDGNSTSVWPEDRKLAA